MGIEHVAFLGDGNCADATEWLVIKVGDARIDFELEQAPFDLAAGEREHRHGDVGVVRGDGGRERAGNRQRSGDSAEAQAARDRALHRGEILAQAIGIGKDAVRPGDDPFALGGQTRVAPPANHDRNTQFGFETADAGTQRWL